MLPRGFSLPAAAALLLALLAPALGGGTSPLAEGVLMAGIAVVALVFPATAVRRGFWIGAGIVLMVALGWAWPAKWNHLPWRAMLEAAEIPVRACTSPDPGSSMRAWVLLLGGLAWAGWCAGIAWTNRSRRMVCEGLAAGIGLIALVAVAARHGHVPGWPAGTGLGPFANRNETTDIFAVGAFLTMACGVWRFGRISGSGAKMAFGLAWLCVLAIYMAALAMDRSRAGPLLFAGMTLGWAFAAEPARGRPGNGLAIGAAVALLLATVFLLTGRSVIGRLAGMQIADFRLKIFSDALHMIAASPWTGTGLGTFAEIFPLYRNASILQESVLHPESDWLWLAAETGLPGALAVAGLLAWMGAQAWRGLARPGERRVRLMACVACLGFLAHSLVDVPAHRLGTMMPALLLLGMAVGGEEGGMRRMRWVLPAAGVVAFTFMLTGLGLKPAATMDWQVYARAAGPEAKQREFLAALRDFRQARFLEPDYAGLPYEEGQIWLNVAPQFAIEPWREALRRMPWEGRAELYQQMLAQSYPAHPELHAPLAALAGGDARMELAFLGWTAPEEFQARMDETLRDDPELTRYDTVQLRALFPLWMMKGNATALAAIMSRHPLWMAAGYRALADYDATRGDYAGAIALMEDNVPPPPIPPPAPPIPHDEAAGRFAEDHGDFAAGMALYSEDIAAGQTDAALQILQVLNAQPGCPAYVHFEAGRLLARQGREQEAWQALKQCEP